jgi:hypothetical protein
VEPRCEILRAETITIGPDMFGQCSSGYLILAGPLLSVHLECKFQKPLNQNMAGPAAITKQFGIRGFHCEIFFEIYPDFDAAEYLKHLSWKLVESKNEPKDVQGKHTFSWVREAEQERYCFLVANYYFLVLERVSATEHVYKRIAVGFLSESRGKPESLFDAAEKTTIKII